jgi:glucose-1-phosphate thymidylyltransferase
MSDTCGIILAGGSGTRLDPLTRIVCKQLLPVFDKPMIYYPLSVLMLGGIRDILIISTAKDTPMLESLFKDGAHLGLNIRYEIQPEPKGIAQAFLIGEKFIAKRQTALVLGDNIFHGGSLDYLHRALQHKEGACIFAYRVRDPQRYGVIEFDAEGKATSLEEKPKQPKSNYAVPGLYVYDGQIAEVCKNLKPSARGELEITDVNLDYLNRGKLHVETLGRGVAWLDTGTPDSLLEAANYIATLEHRQGLKIACIEEIARSMDFIDEKQFGELVSRLPRNEYRAYLEALPRT